MAVLRGMSWATITARYGSMPAPSSTISSRLRSVKRPAALAAARVAGTSIRADSRL